MNEYTYMIKEGSQYAMEGSAPVYQIRVPMKDGSTPTLASAVMYVYKNGADATSTFTTGATSVSGDLITTKTFQALVGGDVLHVTIFCTVNGLANQCVAEFPLIVRRKSGR